MKNFMNSVDTILTESLDGFGAAHGDLVNIHHDPMFVTRAASPIKEKVALISGGGSGHEPLHAGFVGHGMLDAA
ncbi:MAG: dihydroxyacetone kinase subunit DhaK, partial [Rhodospirillales bacterium]|nr:dihydroxyacetone kinase subunit DhaK [Rhodospirillales bacterium]